MNTQRNLRLAASSLVALLVGSASAPALHQGFDLLAQGAPLLGARLALEGTPSANTATPFANAVLGAWMLLAGSKIGALAMLHALTTGIGAGLACWLSWPRAGWSSAVVWSLVGLATAPLPLALTLAIGFAVAWCASPHLRPAIAGGGWVLVAALDPRWGVALLPLAAFAVPRRDGSARSLAMALVVTASIVLLTGLITVGLVPTLSGNVIEPLRDLGDRIVNGGALRFVRTAIAGTQLTAPFGGWPPTGENLVAAWPAQGELRGNALRVIAALPWIAMVWLLLAARISTGRSVHARLAAALFAAAALALVLRGDVNGLRLALVPLTAAMVATIVVSGRRWLFVGLAAVLALPLASETLWLSSHAERPGLVHWDDARGGVRLEAGRAQRWNEIRRQLVPRAGESALIWPANPGLHWILGTTPLTLDDAQPGGTEADRRVADALAHSAPRLVLLGQHPAVSGHQLLERMPRSWEQLRDRYRLAGLVRPEQSDYRLLLPFDGQSADPLAQQLPMVELTVAGETTPAMRPGFQVGQSFRLGGRDLGGFAVRVRTRGRDLTVDIRIQVWQRRASGFDTALLSERVSTTVAGDGSLLWFRTPVQDTAHQDLAITLELRNEIAEELRLDWYVHDEAHEVDFYPEGTAMLGLSPVAADLYFLVY